MIVRIAELNRDLTASAPPSFEIDLGVEFSQALARVQHFAKSRYFESQMMQLSIGVFAVAGADEREAVMVGMTAQKYHAAGHHFFRVDIRHLEAHDLGIEIRSALEIGDFQDHVA